MIEGYFLFNKSLLKDRKKIQEIVKDDVKGKIVANYMLNPTYIFSINTDTHTLNLQLHVSRSVDDIKSLRTYLEKTDETLVNQLGETISLAQFDEIMNTIEKVEFNSPTNDIFNQQIENSLFEANALQKHFTNHPDKLHQFFISNKANYQKALKYKKEIMTRLPNSSFPQSPAMQNYLMKTLAASVRLNLAITTSEFTPMLFAVGILTNDQQKIILDSANTLKYRLKEHQNDYIFEDWHENFEKTTGDQVYDELIKSAKIELDQNHEPIFKPSLSLTNDNNQALKTERLVFKYDDHALAFDLVDPIVGDQHV